ncbi:enoyl-CoA hydratase/isomerase family protein [Hydrogenophaga pseudoflava]|jgi:enoyl-CoA hydratase/carnithine racemase|uniref:Putative enoyl-CoA hydratase echA8 n=1 Tax=Hydrogenophaga pseudoflava TaxID=47421 RepID=A0A4P6WXD3_HYDPS|nr:enoyl-CoA hydratase-related protein [Hydrogenophaga pseudoflava]QBM28672.1 putative enoyl-CoA hydratase echA8 [Hydrogenophaga pseudoflava]
MEATPTIRYEQRGATAWITLDRPDAMNALSGPMCTELLEAIGRIERDPGIRVIVLTGAGRAFCAGADLKGVFEDAGGSPGPIDPMTDFLDQVGAMMERLRMCPKPTIAALNGLTLAGGLELAMACDLIIAADSARIGDAHANFGVFPGAGGAAILPRRIGATAAKYLLFTGDTLPAKELVPLGLVNRVVPDADLGSEVEKLAARIASKSPLVIRRMKQTVADGLEQPQASALRLERVVLDAHRHSHDIREGLAAFVGKRTPDFKGY